MAARAPLPLRFALLCGETLERWQGDCVNHLLATPGVELAVRLIPAEPEPLPGEDESSPTRLAFELWTRWFGCAQALQTVDLPEKLAEIPVLRCAALGAAEPQEADERALRACRGLDFILQLSAAPVPALPQARYGLWRFLHGDPRRPSPAPPCFWELHDGEPLIETALVRMNDAGIVASELKRGVFATRLHSYAGTADAVLARCATWPARVCVELLGGAQIPQRGRSLIGARELPLPSAGQLCGFAARIVLAQARELVRQLFRHDQWNVGVVRAPIDAFLREGGEAPVDWLEAPPRGEFRADPFGVLRGGRLTILFERLRSREGRGTIASLHRDGKSELHLKGVAIGPSVHLSYPFLLEHAGELYCIPETHEAREVCLYRAEDFPWRWTRVATLLHDVAAVDATVFRHDGLWWLACSDRDSDDRADLYLWYASELRGPWQPHLCNPVKSDVRSARPAGTPFVHEGVLYRPAQDCSRTYGGRIALQRVTRLTPTAFAEELAATVEPDPRGPYPHGLHTLSAVGELTLVDGKRTVFDPVEFSRVARRLVQRILPR